MRKIDIDYFNDLGGRIPGICFACRKFSRDGRVCTDPNCEINIVFNVWNWGSYSGTELDKICSGFAATEETIEIQRRKTLWRSGFTGL